MSADGEVLVKGGYRAQCIIGSTEDVFDVAGVVTIVLAVVEGYTIRVLAVESYWSDVAAAQHGVEWDAIDVAGRYFAGSCEDVPAYDDSCAYGDIDGLIFGYGLEQGTCGRVTVIWWTLSRDLAKTM